MEEARIVDAEKDRGASIPGEPEHSGGSFLSAGRVLWPTLLSLAVVALIAYLTFDLQEFRQILRELNPWFLAAAVGSVLVRVAFGGWRLHYVSRGRLTMGGGVKGQVAWDFFANITPSIIGGGPVAALFVARDLKISAGDATALMLFCMLLDQLLFALCIPVMLGLLPFFNVLPASLGGVGRGAFILLFIGLLAWVMLFGYAVLYRPDLFQKLAVAVVRIKWLRRFQDRVVTETEKLRERTQILRTQPPSFFFKGFLITALIWTARFTLPLWIVMSVYPDVDKALIFIRSMAMSVVTIIIPTPGGSGGLEGLYALLIGPLMPRPLMAPTLLTWRFLGYYVFLFAGAFLSISHVHRSVLKKMGSGTNRSPHPDSLGEGPPLKRSPEP